MLPKNAPVIDIENKSSSSMNLLAGIILSITYLQMNYRMIHCTIDVNLSELEYLAAHMDPFECIRLVAALHYTTYELPQSIAGAERKVDEEIPCLHHLIHWNSSPSEGIGKTHEHIEHRLRQLNRKDLADWLGKTVFKELGKDLEKSLENSFGELGEQETETNYPITLNPLDESAEENPWLPIDTLLMALLAGLLATLLVLVVAVVIRKIKSHRAELRLERARRKKNKRSLRNNRRDEEFQ